MEVALDNIRQAEGITTDLQQLKDILEERIGLEVFPSKLKGDLEGRLIIMMDYCKFLKEVNNENI